jgi:Zn-dependent M32 family carboxypeptidase
MNKDRRKILERINNEITTLKCELEDVMNSEQEAYDNMPESFQNGEKGERMQEIIDQLETSVSSLEEVIENILEAIQ